MACAHWFEHTKTPSIFESETSNLPTNPWWVLRWLSGRIWVLCPFGRKSLENQVLVSWISRVAEIVYIYDICIYIYLQIYTVLDITGIYCNMIYIYTYYRCVYRYCVLWWVWMRSWRIVGLMVMRYPPESPLSGADLQRKFVGLHVATGFVISAQNLVPWCLFGHG